MKRKFIYVTFAVFALFLAINTKCFATFEIDKFYIKAEVESNGDMNVTEIINYYSNETVNGLTREIQLKNSQNIKNSADGFELNTIMVDGEICSQIPISSGSIGDKYVYEFSSASDSYNIKLYTPFEYETKTVVYSYKLKNVAVKYNDIGEIYWNFIGDEWDCNINNLTIDIILPEEAANETSYVFGHGSDDGTFSKNGNYITLKANNIKSFQPIDARILFSRNAISDSNKIVNKNVLNKYINEEEGLSKTREEEKLWGIISVKGIALIFVVYIAVFFVFSYIKFDKEHKVKSEKYYRELPFGLEPELLQLFYYGKIVDNSYYVAVLNLIKLGVFKLEKSVNKVGKEVQKIIFNKNHGVKLKPHQKAIERTIKSYMYENTDGSESIDLLSLGSKMSKSFGGGYRNFVKELESEKEGLVGKPEKAPKNVKVIPILLLIVQMLAVIIIGLHIGNVEMFGVPFMMGFLTLVYSIFFISVGNAIPAILFLIFHCGVFQFALVSMMIAGGIGWLYIPYILTFMLIIYVHRIEKFSKEERNIVEQIKGLRRYINDFSMLKDKEGIEYINLWEDYFIMAVALKLNTKTINYFYDYGKNQSISNLGCSINYTNSYRDLHTHMYTPFHGFQRAHTSSSSSSSGSSYSGSSGGFSGGSSSGGGGGRRRRWRPFLNIKLELMVKK